MKKFILAATIVLGSFSAFAQAESTGTSTDTKTTTTPSATTSEYTEVPVAEVPAPVMAALKKAYPDAKLDKTSVNAQKEYKLDVMVGDKVGSLYADAKGKWITK
jgi:ABC-type glycerol-3-phosphate transport system substrate-binding protein